MTEQLRLMVPHQQPLVICCGLGVDSVAMLAGLKPRGIRPDLIIFADTGSERQATYDYLQILNAWLRMQGFPELTIVRYVPKDFKHWPPYFSLEENLLTNVTLPAIAYGGHSCSAKWKITPINSFCNEWKPAQTAWACGVKVIKAIGFEDSPHERKRAQRGCRTFAIQTEERDKYELWFPLQDWGWNRKRCELEILLAGLPVPAKSSCYFCTAMKPWEVDALEPGKLRRIVVIEARTARRHLEYARQRAAEHHVVWDGKPLTEGLWRKAVKGRHANGQPNGSTPRPGSMTEYIRRQGLLPAEEIDRIIQSTPTEPLSQKDFRQLGHANWQAWLHSIIQPQNN